LVVAAILASPVLGQVPVTVGGRVFDGGTGSGIQSAIVELVGHGAQLTSADGTFVFDRVEPGVYTLRIAAFGYTSEVRSLRLHGDLTATVPLDPAPLRLDSLLVEPRSVEFDGRVRDVETDLPVVDAEVVLNGVPAERTSLRGRFSLDDAWEGVPLYLGLRAFGYLPMDTVLFPVDEHGRYDFRLDADPIAAKMIQAQIVRIAERAGGRRAITMAPLARDRLLGWTGLGLGDVLRASYPRRRLQAVRCIFVDERLLPPGIDGDVVESISPGDVERVEFLFEGAVLRIYTRDFTKRMIAGQVELRKATYVEVPGGAPFCT
jgi:hypothetical protein